MVDKNHVWFFGCCCCFIWMFCTYILYYPHSNVLRTHIHILRKFNAVLRNLYKTFCKCAKRNVWFVFFIHISRPVPIVIINFWSSRSNINSDHISLSFSFISSAIIEIGLRWSNERKERKKKPRKIPLWSNSHIFFFVFALNFVHVFFFLV